MNVQVWKLGSFLWQFCICSLRCHLSASRLEPQDQIHDPSPPIYTRFNFSSSNPCYQYVVTFVHSQIIQIFHLQSHKSPHKKQWWTSLVPPGHFLCAPNEGDLGSIPGQGSRSHMLQLKILHATIKIKDPVCRN